MSGGSSSDTGRSNAMLTTLPMTEIAALESAGREYWAVQIQ
jgi:hypothetical protein